MFHMKNIYILTTDPTIITGIQKQSEKVKLKSIQKLSGRYFYKSEKVAAFSSNWKTFCIENLRGRLGARTLSQLVGKQPQECKMSRASEER